MSASGSNDRITRQNRREREAREAGRFRNKARSGRITLIDQNGKVCYASKQGNFLRIEIEGERELISIDLSATHLGKILELVVDQFFPSGTCDDFKAPSTLDVRSE